METISLKLEDNFAKDLDLVMKKHRYTTKTEFIREAIRDKIKTLEKDDVMLQLQNSLDDLRKGKASKFELKVS